MKKVWIDCDPGIDDTLALLYALNNPELEVLGISATGGNVGNNMGVSNIVNLLDYIGMFKDDFVYKGEDYADCYATDTHGNNGLGNYYLPQSKKIHNTGAVNAIRRVIRQYPDEVTIIALAPLSTINRALVDEYVNLVKEVIIMGGAYRSPGNCSPLVEFNFWCDSESAHKLFSKFNDCNKLRVVPLDITRKFVLTKDRLKEWDTKIPNLNELIKGITQFYFDFHKLQEGLDGCVINDVVAVYLATHSGNYIYSYVQVLNVNNNIVDGIMVVDENNFYKHLPNAQIYLDCDIDNIWTDLLNALMSCENNLCDK